MSIADRRILDERHEGETPTTIETRSVGSRTLSASGTTSIDQSVFDGRARESVEDTQSPLFDRLPRLSSTASRKLEKRSAPLV